MNYMKKRAANIARNNERIKDLEKKYRMKHKIPPPKLKPKEVQKVQQVQKKKEKEKKMK